MKILAIEAFNEAKSLQDVLRARVFAMFPYPSHPVRNRWRSITKMLANVNEEMFIGGESGVCDEAVFSAYAW